MRTMMTRRSALCGIAFLPALSSPGRATTRSGAQSLPAGNSSACSSTIAELLADYDRKNAEWLAAADEAERMFNCARLPTVAVKHGRRLVRDRESGIQTYQPWVHSNEGDILNIYRPRPCFHAASPNRLQRRQLRNAAVAELRRQRAARLEAEHASGVTAANAREKEAYAARETALTAIYAYRPATGDEAAAKDAFLAAELTRGVEFQDRDLALIFGGGASPWSPPNPNVVIERSSVEIANAMAALHGGDWRRKIDHKEGLVVIVRRGA